MNYLSSYQKKKKKKKKKQRFYQQRHEIKIDNNYTNIRGLSFSFKAAIDEREHFAF